MALSFFSISFRPLIFLLCKYLASGFLIAAWCSVPIVCVLLVYWEDRLKAKEVKLLGEEGISRQQNMPLLSGWE